MSLQKPTGLFSLQRIKERNGGLSVFFDLRYQTASQTPDIFDDDLADKVRLFQRDNRLDVDGLAGHQTQIIINTLLNPDSTPRLVIPRLAQE